MHVYTRTRTCSIAQCILGSVERDLNGRINKQVRDAVTGLFRSALDAVGEKARYLMIYYMMLCSCR